MGVYCSTQRSRQATPPPTLKCLDPLNQHDQAILELQAGRGARLIHLQDEVLLGFGKQFQATFDNSYKESIMKI